MTATHINALLAILRRNRQLAEQLREAAVRRQQFDLMEGQAERLAWIQQRIDELEARYAPSTREE